jgi:hypothetical protein
MSFFVAALLIFIEVVIGITINTTTHVNRATDIASAGDSMVIYSNYATAYAQQNPGFTGVPTVSALNLPAWFNIPKTNTGAAVISAYVQGGHAYTYYTGTVLGVGGYLAQKLQNGYIAGINKNGVLSSPILPATATATETIPAPVPNGSTVLIP